MRPFRMLAALAALVCSLASPAALADTDCSDPVAEWKPRDLLRQQVEQLGWTVRRIKIDDGCYELRGVDRMGNKIKAKYAPASLRIRSLEVEFEPGADASDYLGRPQAPIHPRERSGPPSKGHVP